MRVVALPNQDKVFANFQQTERSVIPDECTIHSGIKEMLLTGPVHICSRYTIPAKCSRNKFSVHERSDYEHGEMFSFVQIF